jgi:hypothetical protein
MRHKMIQAIPVIALALLLAGPVKAVEKPKDQMDKEMNRLEVRLHNSMVKMKNEIGALGAAPQGPVAQKRDAKMVPAGRGCEDNLIVIADAAAHLREMLRNLRYQFRDNEKRAGNASVRAMGFHLDDMESRVKQFAGTGEKELATKFLELAMLAVRNLREEKLKLDACCGELLPKLPPPSDQ